MNIKSYMKKIAVLVYLLVLLVIEASCAEGVKSPDHIQQGNNCESLVDENAKLKCYSNLLRISVHREISSAIRDWAEFEANMAQGDPRSGLRVEIELNEKGEVKNIFLAQPSRNLSFDNAIIQAIHNAAPFALPRDKKLRKQLLKFSYDIVL